jgi:hypothetical protein
LVDFVFGVNEHGGSSLRKDNRSGDLRLAGKYNRLNIVKDGFLKKLSRVFAFIRAAT